MKIIVFVHFGMFQAPTQLRHLCLSAAHLSGGDAWGLAAQLEADAEGLGSVPRAARNGKEASSLLAASSWTQRPAQ